MTNFPIIDPDKLMSFALGAMFIFFTIILLGFGIGWKVANYKECRTHGFSSSYCLAQR